MKQFLIIILIINIVFLEVNAIQTTNELPITTYTSNEINKIDEIKRFGIETIKSGFLEIIHYDYENQKSETRYVLHTDDGIYYRLYMNAYPKDIKQTKIRLEGIQYKEEIFVTNYELSVEAKDIPAIGEQKILVVLVNFQDKPIEPISLDEARNRIFNEDNENSMQSYIQEVSYKKAFLSGDIFGWYTLPYNQNTLCSASQLADVIIPLIDNDVNFLDYKRMIISFPVGCTFGGSAMLNPKTVITNDGTATFTVAAVKGEWNLESGIGVHELGHNFGLGHANDLECGDSIISTNCQSIVYGDDYDVMGFSGGKGFFNSINLEKINWIDLSQIKEVTSPGIYTLEPLEISGGIKAIKIPTANNYEYYIEYRRAIGFDRINANNYGKAVYDGAMIHIDTHELNQNTYLLDMTPHIDVDDTSQYFDSIDVVLKEGETFTDIINNVLIRTISLTDENIKLEIGEPSKTNNIKNIQIKTKIEKIPKRP